MKQGSLEKDVVEIVNTLKQREWAEHFTTTELGQELEAEITKLIGQLNHYIQLYIQLCEKLPIPMRVIK
ncbi:hypothetical protein BHC46_12390 [Snodgrassella alvi]|uniref:Uncharacterized protein n=1 Tax=Snodgrassella alvi TaxID=1196083 RepID=A0A2N9XBA4_9NEIS|nr:hypothetical protein [Snodgrassella alvi]PIT43795.1 hypothetical protein BHC46_12390 [Snodgrassella alvi]